MSAGRDNAPTQTPDEMIRSAEVIIAGSKVDPFAAPPPCAHGPFLQEVVVANLVDNAGAFVDWRLQVKVRCAQCGVPMRYKTRATPAPDSDLLIDGAPDVILSADRRTLGVIIEPLPEDERPNDWVDARTQDEAP